MAAAEVFSDFLVQLLTLSPQRLSDSLLYFGPVFVDQSPQFSLKFIRNPADKVINRIEAGLLACGRLEVSDMMVTYTEILPMHYYFSSSIQSES